MEVTGIYIALLADNKAQMTSCRNSSQLWAIHHSPMCCGHLYNVHSFFMLCLALRQILGEGVVCCDTVCVVGSWCDFVWCVVLWSVVCCVPWCNVVWYVLAVVCLVWAGGCVVWCVVM